MITRAITTCLAMAGLIAACAPVDAPSPGVAEATPSPIPDIGFDPNVSNAAVDGCVGALDAQTDGNVDVVASEFSQANTAVYMEVGPQRAPWRCLVSQDGQVAELSFLGDEGSL